MDNEKYGIELELVTNKFNQKIQQVKSAFGSLTDKKVNLNTNTDQIEYLKQQIKEISSLLDLNSRKPFMDYTDVLKNRAELEKLTNQYNKLISKQNEVSTSSTKASLNINKGLDKMTSKIRRFGLSLLSIRSIWALVSRASSAYLSQDTEMANKLQSAWVGLGAVLAPIINFVATLILKLVGTINTVVKALTGVDLMAKASAKSLGGTAKAAKSLNKALAGFDELQNLDTDDGGGTAGGINLGDYFKNADVDWSVMMESFYNKLDEISNNGFQKIKDAKEKVVNYLQEKGWSKGVIDGFSQMMDGIGKLWEGLITTVKGVVEIIDGILSLDKEKIIQGFKDLFLGIGEMFSGALDFVFGIIKIIGSILWEAIKEAGTAIYDGFIKPVIDWFTNMWNIIKTKTTEVWNIISNFVINVGKKTGEIVSSAFRAVVNAVLGTIERFLNAPIRTINALIGTINTLPGVNLSRLTTFSFPRLDVGTNYVPEDQLAMIHKGEAVVPKKFNSKEYFGGTSDETNSKLEELIEAVREIEINPYTTIRDVGKASLNYINSKSRQLGESVVM